jgi:hypothetical protein
MHASPAKSGMHAPLCGQNPADFSVVTTSDWVQQIGLPQHAPLTHAASIDGDVLTHIASHTRNAQDAVLEEIGVSSGLDRSKIMSKWLRELRRYGSCMEGGTMENIQRA